MDTTKEGQLNNDMEQPSSPTGTTQNSKMKQNRNSKNPKSIDRDDGHTMEVPKSQTNSGHGPTLAEPFENHDNGQDDQTTEATTPGAVRVRGLTHRNSEESFLTTTTIPINNNNINDNNIALSTSVPNPPSTQPFEPVADAVTVPTMEESEQTIIDARIDARFKDNILITEQRMQDLINQNIVNANATTVHERSQNKQNFFKYLIVVLAVIALIAVGIVIAILFANKGDGPNANDESQSSSQPTTPVKPTTPMAPTPTSAPSGSPFFGPTIPSSSVTSWPTPAPSNYPTINPKFASWQQQLENISGDALYDTSSIAHKALSWLSFDDQQQVPSTLSTKWIERYVVVVMYFAFDGPSWHQQLSFLSSSSVCEWNDGQKGIICDSSGFVIDVMLGDNNLVGEIPDEIFTLSRLQSIKIQSNFVTGTIPENIGDSSQLLSVDFSQNELTGTIPESVFTLPRVIALIFYQNPELGGVIPESIGVAKNLEYVSFFDCKLQGSLPSTIGELVKLRDFQVSENFLTSSIPKEMTLLPQLSSLGVGSNMLTGTIPPFANQSSMKYLYFFDNYLDGPLPKSIGYLPSIEAIFFQNNRLRGSIPETWNNLSNLESLGLQQNFLNGTISDEFASLPKMTEYFLEYNQFTGSIPSFSNDNVLLYLDLESNFFTGGIDHIFSTFPTSMVSLDFGLNSLTGTISSHIGNFKNLNFLSFYQCGIGGSLPTEIGNLSSLTIMGMSENLMTGSIPTEIGLMQKLSYLDITSNSFSGVLPSELGLLTKLENLSLAYNNFMGTVPTSFGSLTLLSQLWLQDNDLSGNVNSILCPLINGVVIDDFCSDCLHGQEEITCICCTSCYDEHSGCIKVNEN